jgi:hypothetical protein
MGLGYSNRGPSASQASLSLSAVPLSSNFKKHMILFKLWLICFEIIMILKSNVVNKNNFLN